MCGAGNAIAGTLPESLAEMGHLHQLYLDDNGEFFAVCLPFDGKDQAGGILC